jgi:Fe-S oxidoreductase
MITPAGIVLVGAIAGLGVQAARLRRRWSVGRPVHVDWRRGLARLPHAYLHTVHDVVARDPYAARMHMLAAGGLLAALALSLVRHVLGIGGDLAALAVVASVAVSAIGTCMVAWRRRPPRPARLTGGQFDALPGVLAAALLFLLLAALWTLPGPGWSPDLLAPGWLAIAALGAASLGTLVLWTVGGPLRHAVAGLVHLAAHHRQRFGGALATDLVALPLSGSPLPQSLGVGAVADFGWNRLVAFDACVQCGRCQEACPAFAAGQPLNPKALIQSLVQATAAAPAAPLVGPPEAAAIAADTLWACTTCRACVHECPMLIEHVDAIIDLRRHATLEHGAVPPNAAVALTDLRQTDTASGRALDARLDWAADLGLPVLADVGRADILLWVGEAGFDRRNQRSLRALVALLRRAAVNFAVLAEELDCGDLARRLGDEITFQDLARRNIATLGRHAFDAILTMDPHALHVLRNEYPAFGGRYRVLHHASFLADLIDAGRLAVAPGGGTVSYHDPCYLARYNGEVDAPRRLLRHLGAPVVELERSGLRARCCGWGGGAALADVPARRRIPDLRMDQARATGAPTLAVACPNCANMLEGVTGARPAVADLAELVLEAVERGAIAAPAPA